jgi:hypothetical protein
MEVPAVRKRERRSSSSVETTRVVGTRVGWEITAGGREVFRVPAIPRATWV